ncbi:hypothetical protein DXT88_04575 [Herbaspirillum lusitanum]|uniref:hypothetical protein n=1 Tax=Herbaspirillum lusitanum TaxID=213312 RepID=UPI002238D3CB|nr:hypothetical protein [Herbaspirillum lusitanum]MCW5297443.1 hypothetical protein [Herbaspirillum lusitanum]
MTFDLRSALPFLLPKAISWAQEREKEILNTGIPLTEYEISLAKRVGVSEPEKVRISIVHGQLPLPSDLALRQAGLATGLFGPHMAGITLGHSICICRPHESIRLLSHELRHVHQYEQMGSIAAFLPVYLQQIVDYEYANAPYEVDARSHEIPA